MEPLVDVYGLVDRILPQRSPRFFKSDRVSDRSHSRVYAPDRELHPIGFAENFASGDMVAWYVSVFVRMN